MGTKLQIDRVQLLFVLVKKKPVSLNHLNILSNEVANGILSVWHRSDIALTTSNLVSKTSSFSGEYSSSGMIKSCR